MMPITKKAIPFFLAFALGVLVIGLALLVAQFDSSKLRGLWASLISPEGRDCKLASACDTRSQEDEIFFISCGGIF